jgi:hypothetical protein
MGSRRATPSQDTKPTRTFLSFLYNMTYVEKKDFTLYFKPDADCGLDQLNVLPDFLEPDVIRVRKVHNPLIATVEASSDVKGPSWICYTQVDKWHKRWTCTERFLETSLVALPKIG